MFTWLATSKWPPLNTNVAGIIHKTSAEKKLLLSRPQLYTIDYPIKLTDVVAENQSETCTIKIYNTKQTVVYNTIKFVAIVMHTPHSYQLGSSLVCHCVQCNNNSNKSSSSFKLGIMSSFRNLKAVKSSRRREHNIRRGCGKTKTRLYFVGRNDRHKNWNVR